MSISSIGGSNAASVIQQMRDRMFSRADTDQSGGISLEEFKAAAPPGGPPRGGPPPGGPPQAGGAQSAGRSANTAGTAAASSLEAVFSSLDTDGDGTVTQTEMAARDGHRRESPIGGDAMATLLSAQEQSDIVSTGQSGGGLGQAIEQMIHQAVGSHARQGGNAVAFTSVTA